jgi:hypothetical protein
MGMMPGALGNVPSSPDFLVLASLCDSQALLDVIDLTIRVWALYDYWPQSDEQTHRLRGETSPSDLPTVSIINKIEKRLEINRSVLFAHIPSSCDPVDFARPRLCTLYEGVIGIDY